MTRWIVVRSLVLSAAFGLALVGLAPVEAIAQPEPPPAQKQFYAQVFEQFTSNRAAGVSAHFDAQVTMNVDGKRRRYAKRQAANKLDTYLRRITFVRKHCKILKRTKGFMIFRIRGWIGGRPLSADITLFAKPSGKSYLITEIDF